jgi:hypothetical protein
MEDYIEGLKVPIDETEKTEQYASEVLNGTRRALKGRINHFRARDVFEVHDGADWGFNGLGLMRYERDYAAEESKRRGLTGGSAAENVTQSQAPDVTMATLVED